MYFNLAESQQNEVMTRMFQAFDTLESTDEVKQQVQRTVNRRLEEIKKTHMNVNKWELNYNMFENLIERRAENNHDAYRIFFLRYLTPHMRELVWKGVLLDGIKMREYDNNVKNEKVFTVSKDDLYILQNCQQILRQNFHSLGDDSYEQLMIYKQLMIYTQAFFRKTVMSDNYFYLMIPILSVFRNYQTKFREKYLASCFITMIEQIYSKAAPKFNERDSRDYEQFVRNIIMGTGALMETIDQELAMRLREMLEYDDEEIKSYYMDLMSNVRRGEITHIPNADLSLSKQQIIFGELLRSFVERMSVGFINIKATLVIWDALSIKLIREPSDLIVAFCLILFHFKVDFFRCKNILQVVKLFKERALLMHDYDFYVLFFNYYKDKDLSSQFDPPDVAQNRTCFKTLQDIMAENLRKKIEEQSIYDGDGKSSFHSSYYGKADNIIEDDEQQKAMASRVVGKVNLQQMEKDILKDYQ